MAFKQATGRTVEGLNEFWQNNDFEVVNNGMPVPTIDKYPVVTLQGGRVVMTHTDLEYNAVCTMQLRGMITGYEKLQTQIIEYATSPAYAFMQTTHERMWQLLNDYKMVATEVRDQSIMGDLIQKLMGHLGENAQVIAMGERDGLPNLGEDEEFFQLVLGRLGFNPKRLQARLQMEFLADFARYAELTHKLLLAHLKIEQLGQLLKALKREFKARETADELRAAQGTIRELESHARVVAVQHDEALNEASIKAAADMLMAMGQVTLSEGAVMAARPDIGAQVLAEVLTRKAAAAAPEPEALDWLDEFTTSDVDRSGDGFEWLTQVDPGQLYTVDASLVGGGRGDQQVGPFETVNLDGENLTGQGG